MPRTFSYDVNLRDKYLVEEKERQGGERKESEERKSSLIVSRSSNDVNVALRFMPFSVESLFMSRPFSRCHIIPLYP